MVFFFLRGRKCSNSEAFHAKTGLHKVRYFCTQITAILNALDSQLLPYRSRCADVGIYPTKVGGERKKGRRGRQRER